MSDYVLAAHLRTLADACAHDQEVTPLNGDQTPEEYMAAYSRIGAMRTSAFRLSHRADDVAGGRFQPQDADD